MTEECYDYFNSDEPEDEEPLKTSDVDGNMDDGNHSTSTNGNHQDKNNQETENLQEKPDETEVDAMQPEKTVGLWGKIKNYILG